MMGIYVLDDRIYRRSLSMYGTYIYMQPKVQFDQNFNTSRYSKNIFKKLNISRAFILHNNNNGKLLNC